MYSRQNWIYPSLLSALLLFTSLPAVAQLLLQPAQRPAPQQAQSHKTKGSAAGRTALTPMDLPFWDDFSFTHPLRPHSPNDTLWEKGVNVYVGNGIAINPPTIYAASFDGLDSVGLPYTTEVLSNGYTDELTSRPLRMAAADKSSTYLTFYFQWKGNGDPPEPADFLAVEFKDDEDKWVERTRIYPGGHIDKTVFYDTMLFVSGDKYYHDNFQFRFRSHGRESGPFDTWSVDYVHLDDFRQPDTYLFQDRALGSDATSLLGIYRAIPLVHFVQNPRFQRSFVDLTNYSQTSASGLETTAQITNYYDGQDPVRYSAVLKDTTGGNVYLHQRNRWPYINDLDASTILQLDPMPDSIDIEVMLHLNSKDSTDPNDDAKSLSPFKAELNDTLRTLYRLKEYYAYDDGSAEYSVMLANPNNRCVVEFPMLTEDFAYLTGFDIYLPSFGVESNQTMDFLVYEQDPDSDQPAENPTLVFNRTIQRQGLDTFFHVGPIIPAILVKNKFYVGWLAPAIGKPKVGVDYSNDTGSRIWVNVNGVWGQNPSGFASSIMIRPYVQFSEPPVVGVVPGAEPGMLTVFPNPCAGSCFIRGSYDGLMLMNSTGQPVPFDEERQDDDRTRVSFPTAAPGLYLLRITKGNTSKIEKLIVVN